ncbi:MAG: hypothetical protein J7L34_00830 [Thermotogaceae bacterium]|nr:hypothetical protein [Thermotogaceae bacterium]
MKRVVLIAVLVLLTLSLNSCVPLLLIQLDASNATAGRVMDLKVHLVNAGQEGEKVYIRRITEGGSYIILKGEAILDSEKNATFKVIEFNAGDVVYEVHGKGFISVFNVAVKKPAWAVGVYMAADNSLNDLVGYDIEEMSNLSEEVSLYVLLDNEVLSGKEIYFSSEPVELPIDEEVNTGNVETLRMFLRNLLSIDAENYAVILWNHGEAWFEDSKYEKESGMSLKAIALDDTSNDALSMREISITLKEVLDEFGIDKLDVLGMDACLMGNLAVSYQMRNVARYLIVSEAVEPGDGWNYEFLSSISASTTPEQFTRMVVDKYREFYQSSGATATLSVYDESKIYDLAISISNLGNALSDAINDDNSIKDEILNNVIPYVTTMCDDSFKAGKNLVDLHDFVERLKTEVKLPSDVNSAICDVLNCLEDVILYSYFQAFSESKVASGISIFLPSSSSELESFYNDLQTLDFYTEDQTNGWFNFLNTLLF